ncbi:hypothetical protein [Novosphingobium sp. SG720]|uniref:hypothetical protein n=1 Tax=Novosphingobium sp. SG720 TaxID=2586998 RepID=UPI001444DBA3|nr:hypothetical protein [Novosphingobium sp. SG720]NKJ43050.1 hypothetical protein [Novosphingobium sp. SG720]
MIPAPWLARLARHALPWIAALILALACRHYAVLAHARAEALLQQQTSFRAAQARAETTARAALDQQQRRLRQLAQNEETRHDHELETARAAALRYGAAHRVQPANSARAASPSPAPTTDHAASIRPPVPAAGVVVSDQDVQACSEVTAYALALRTWALGLDTAVTLSEEAER